MIYIKQDRDILIQKDGDRKYSIHRNYSNSKDVLVIMRRSIRCRTRENEREKEREREDGSHGSAAAKYN